jgi:hypothetical protein
LAVKCYFLNGPINLDDNGRTAVMF